MYNVFIDKLSAKLNKFYAVCNINGYLIKYNKYANDECSITSSPASANQNL